MQQCILWLEIFIMLKSYRRKQEEISRIKWNIRELWHSCQNIDININQWSYTSYYINVQFQKIPHQRLYQCFSFIVSNTSCHINVLVFSHKCISIADTKADPASSWFVLRSLVKIQPQNGGLNFMWINQIIKNL